MRLFLFVKKGKENIGTPDKFLSGTPGIQHTLSLD